jgi:hypothetical protein
MKSVRALLIAAPLLVALAGCHVPLQSYRINPPKYALEVPLPTGNQIKSVPDDPKAKECFDANSPICISFIEVDDMGELWDKGELGKALGIIQQANKAAGTERAPNPSEDVNDPIVIVFVHGWKNNAGWGNDNVTGFMSALQVVYQRNQAKRHVIGIYIGWRGDLVPSYLPVARQFSLYNREATAIRVPGATLSSALTQIAMRTHENSNSLAIFVGHSFGALLLERTLSEMTASQLAVEKISAEEAEAAEQKVAGQNAKMKADVNSPQAEGAAKDLDLAAKQQAAKHAVDSRADLVIFVNSAASATEAKQTLDFLTANQFSYQPFAPAGTNTRRDNPADDRPLFVSVTSTADLATKLALPIGHFPPDVAFKLKGSFRDVSTEPGKKYELDCFDPQRQHPTWSLTTKERGAQAQSSYYLSSAPHMPVLQSHLMLKAVGANQMRVSSTGEIIQVDPQAIAECRKDLFDPKLNIVSTFKLYDTQQCFAIQKRPNRCNGTPYWMMEIDPDIVPDHSTIFTGRFISFLIDSFFTTPQGKPMNRLHPQLMNSPAKDGESSAANP